jgi:sulfopropanediol 3-dehydrogenase
MIIADDSADPSLVACDLLGQAEHDPNACIALVCFSEKFAEACDKEVQRQLAVLPTKNVAEISWANNGAIYIAENKDEAIEISDDWAPEHLELHVEELDYFFDNLTNYGSLFIGEETTVAYGDKGIGTNHILPTSRAARYTGGVWVGKFIKTVTYQKMTPEASVSIGEVVERQCEIEKMLAHGITARVRVDRYTQK